ncbi:hypothetical protein CHUAL_000138 [Chamberlinius hualienensis]
MKSNGNGLMLTSKTETKQKLNSEVMTNASHLRKRINRIIFVSLFIDLLAFTMILPLLPSLLDYYRQNDKDGLFPYLQSKVNGFQKWVGAPDSFNSVLFGGLIGSLYSFLQFLASPVIGSLSDVYGRRPILLICMAGEAVAYFLWAFSSNFTIFVLARIMGGISNGNVSLSTAIMTDVSGKETRGKGMALIGIAFSIGFIVGPMTGAFISIWAKPQLERFYVVPAILALLLAVLNVIYLAIYFEETLPPQKRAKSLGSAVTKAYQLIWPTKIFQFKAVDGLSLQGRESLCRLGQIYFLYLFLYSGLEYTLTFLMHIQFGYTSMQQGKMFLFIGIVMALVQGGYTRRIPAGQEKKTAIRGIFLIIPSFVIVGLASSTWLVFFGLALYAFASASVVPCLTTLVSSYGSYDQKGKLMGIFRSIGALARSLGPVVASFVYWSFGPTLSYCLGGALLTIPLILLRKLHL